MKKTPAIIHEISQGIVLRNVLVEDVGAYDFWLMKYVGHGKKVTCAIYAQELLAIFWRFPINGGIAIGGDKLEDFNPK